MIYYRRGSTGYMVLHIQVLLNARGWRPELVADGEFGPVTESAVLWYQASQGLEHDGVVGPLTMAALERGSVPPSSPPGTPMRVKALKVSFAYHAAACMEDPPGSNTGGPLPGFETKYSVDSIEAAFDMSEEPWCAMFAYRCFHEAGWPQPTGDLASVYGWAQLGRSMNALYQPSQIAPAAGDLFLLGSCLDYSTGLHIGFVEAWDSVSRCITTIEGNCHDRVSSLVRGIDSIGKILRVPG